MNMTFIKDIFSEDKGGKYSSKKTMGILGFILCAGAFVVDGFHFYIINEHLFDSLLIASCTLLGLSVTKSIFSKKSSAPVTPPQEDQPLNS